MLQSRDWLAKFGLLIAEHDDGIEVQGMPLEADTTPESLIQAILEERAAEVAGEPEERVAARLAASMAVRVGKALKPEEMVDLVDRLFGCSRSLDPLVARSLLILNPTNSSNDSADAEQRLPVVKNLIIINVLLPRDDGTGRIPDAALLRGNI